MRLYNPDNKDLNAHLKNFVGSEPHAVAQVEVEQATASANERNKWAKELLNEFEELTPLIESSQEPL